MDWWMNKRQYKISINFIIVNQKYFIIEIMLKILENTVVWVTVLWSVTYNISDVYMGKSPYRKSTEVKTIECKIQWFNIILVAMRTTYVLGFTECVRLYVVGLWTTD